MGNIEYLKIKNYSDYKKLVENIENLCSDKRPLVVIPELLSNIEEEEITINIANTLALKENKILIIDCNFRNLSTYEQFDISNNFGLYEVLVEDINVEDIIVNIDNNLDLLFIFVPITSFNISSYKLFGAERVIVTSPFDGSTFEI